MNGHATDAQILAFSDAELGENEAILVALHLDDCPLCAGRAAALEPLGAAFADIQDPLVPPGLSADVLALAEGASPADHRLVRGGRDQEIAVGAGLLAVAAVLAVGFGDPLGWIARAAVLVQATSQAGRALQVVLPSSLLILTAVLLAGSAAVVIARPGARHL